MWFVYILECSDGSYYSGITKDIQRRLEEHNSSYRGAKYTRSRRPVRVVAALEVEERSTAAKLEVMIKKLPHTKKITGLLEAKNRF